MMFNKVKEFFTKIFRIIRYKILGSKFYEKFFDKQTDSKKMKRFLKNISAGRYTVKSKTGRVYVLNYDDPSVITLAIENGYVRNVDWVEDSVFLELEIWHPSVTIDGENFLRNHSFFNSHPFFEKIVIAAVSSIITLLIGYFSK